MSPFRQPLAASDGYYDIPNYLLSIVNIIRLRIKREFYSYHARLFLRMKVEKNIVVLRDLEADSGLGEDLGRPLLDLREVHCLGVVALEIELLAFLM